MPEGSSFPYDFGFIPSTLGEDSDPLDVLVLMDGSVPVGCVLTVRLIGVIEAKQRKGDWIRNDRLLAVATPARTHEHLANLEHDPTNRGHPSDAHARKLRRLELKPIHFDRIGLYMTSVPTCSIEVEAVFANYDRLNGRGLSQKIATVPSGPVSWSTFRLISAATFFRAV